MREKGCYFNQTVSTQEALAMIEHEDEEGDAYFAALYAVAVKARELREFWIVALGPGEEALAAALDAFDALEWEDEAVR